MSQPPVSEANTPVLADKVCWSSSSGDGYHSSSLDGSYCFRLDSQGHSFYGVYELEGEEISISFGLGDDFSVFY